MGKPWLKLWVDILPDRKLRRVDPTARWCWIGCLCLACEAGNAGRLELTGEALTDREIADACGVEVATWQSARTYFLRSGMLLEDGGTLVVANWERRQASPDATNAERKRRWRERHDRAVPSNPGTRSGTRTGTDKRKKTEEEVEVDVEVENREEIDDYNNMPPGDSVSSSSSAISSLRLDDYRNGILWRFGRMPEDVESLLPELAEKGTIEWVLDALALTRAKRKPAAYALGILVNWQAEGRGRNNGGKP